MERHKNIEHKEDEPKNRVLEFFELPVKEKYKLKDRIAHHGGIVRLFVHPHYNDYANFEEKKGNLKLAKKLRQMELAFEKIISLPPEEVPPIVIIYGIEGLAEIMEINGQPIELEEYKEKVVNIKRLGDYIKNRVKKYEVANDIFIIPATLLDPTPIIGGYVKDEVEAWSKFRDKLKDLDVKKIIIGGAELHIPHPALIDEENYKQGKKINIMKELAGCMGKTINELSDSFVIELSTLSFLPSTEYKEGRKEIRKLEKELSMK